MTDPSIADPPSPYSPTLAKPAPVVRPVAAQTKLLLEGPIFATLLRLAAPNILNLVAFVAVIIFMTSPRSASPSIPWMLKTRRGRTRGT
jgi:hypothetical protein